MKKSKNRKYLKALSVNIILALQLNTVAFAADTTAVPDASEGKAPIVESAANDTVIVDIRTPNEAGLSHNQYQDLQVGSSGIIFNNSRDITPTQLAGYITGNPNIGRTGADVILNEVTGRNITNLNGFIEVAGKQADVVIANPNGIVGNNFGYINTGRAILTTGNPQIDPSGRLAGFVVNQGEISIEGRGLDAAKANRLDLYAQAVKINAQIAAQKLKMVGGRNKLDADGNVMTVIDDQYTGVALDVGAMGSMYANAIYMIGTTKGLGVNMEGEAYANDGDFVLTASGDIRLKSKLQAAQDVAVNAGEALENTGSVYGQNIQIKANTLNNTGGETAPVIAARENISIEADTVNNTDNALIMGANDVSLTANELKNHSAVIEAGQNMRLDVKNINNINIHYEVEPGVVIGEEDIYEVQLDGASVRYKAGEYKILHGVICAPDTPSVAGYDIFYRKDDWDEDKDYQIVTPGGSSSRWHEYSYHRVIRDDVIKTTVPAKIIAGGAMRITADEVTNDKSEITAGKDLIMDAGVFHNIDGMGTRVVTDIGRAGAFYKADAGGQWNHYMVTRERWGDYHKEARTDIIVQPATALLKAEAADEAQTHAAETLAVSQSQLYHLAKPDATYYIETDPAFTNKKQWLSSDYFFNKMQYDPDTIGKKISDGYYEQQIVKDQLVNLTGKYYIGDYASMEEQYQALLDHAVVFAQNSQAKIGVALTKEQQEALKTPIVWMVEKSVLLPGGDVVTALVPELYLPKDTLKKQGAAVLSAKDIDVKTTNDILNSGSIIAGDINKLSAHNINNVGGRIVGSDVLLSSQNDINNTGGSLLAEHRIDLNAGNDIRFETTTRTGATGQGATTKISQVAGAYITKEDGELTMRAQNDIDLTAAEIAAKGRIDLAAGRDITLGAKEISDSNHILFGANAYRNDSSQKDIGTTLAAGKDITLNAGGKIDARAAEINTAEKLSLHAGEDINITAGKEKTFVEEWSKDTWHGIASSRTTIRHDIKNEQSAVESSLGGKEIAIEAENALTIEGSRVIGDKDVTLTAKNDINIEGAAETRKELHERKVKQSGIFGSGFGFTIGSRTTEDDTDQGEKSRHGSTVGSTAGSVGITSEKDVNVTASDIIAKRDITLTGENVNITAAPENYDYTYTHKEKQSGLTVSLGGGAIGQLTENIIQPLERAATAQDERLKALSAIKAASHIHEIPKAIEAVKDGRQSITNLNIGFGKSESQTTIESSTVAAHESSVAAGKDVNITAAKKDINIVGSDVTGENVNLTAKGDINITAASQSNVTNTESKSSQAFAGASIGLGTGTVGVAVSASKGKETIDENSTAYKKSTVTAREQLTITSGEDTNIIGSKVIGNKVKADIGGDLNLESLQETNRYRSDSVNGGFGFNTALGKNPGSTLSVSANIGKTSSDYRSVTEQAGIYAGKEGFDLTVGNNTDLKGAVIASEAEKEKNRLTTGTLSFRDLSNKAEYESKGIGLTLNANKTSGDQPATEGEKGLIPNIPAKVSDDAESTTKSAVSEGTITVTKPEKQKQDVSTLNRDTKETLNQLEPIFDIEKIRENQETAALFGELAANGIHVVAEKNHWKDGSPEKIALHAAVCAVLADLTNGNAAAGAIAGGSTEYLAKAILKASKGDKAQAQWIAMIVGAAMSKATGGNAQLGAMVAINVIKNNELYTKEELQELLRDNEWGEQLCKIKGIDPTPENIAEIENTALNKIEETRHLKIHAYMVYGEGGVTKGIGVGAGVLLDANGNPYATGDGSLSKGIATPLNGEVCAITIIPLDSTLKLNDAVIMEILTGKSVGLTGYAGVGGGLSAPIDSKYQGRAVILKRGFGSPQIGVGIGATDLVDKIVERRKEGPFIED